MNTPKWLADARDEVVPPPDDSGLNILIFDIETAPEANWTWERYNTNTLGMLRPDYALSFVYTWYKTGEYHFVGQNKDPKYRPDNFYAKPRPTQDRWVVARMWHLFDMADIVVAHNGKKFDVPYMQGRFTVHGLGPTSMFSIVDTLLISRTHWRHASHALNELSAKLLNERKVAHYGMSTWWGCMQGDPLHWAKMEEYNLKDVVLLERLYEKQVPWVGRPKSLPIPNANRFDDGRPTMCPKPGCGGTKLHIRRRLPPTAAGLVYRQFQCQTCRGYFRASYAERNVTPTWERVKS